MTRLYVFLLLFISSTAWALEFPCKNNCSGDLNNYPKGSQAWRELAMLQNHSVTRDPDFFACQDRQYTQRLLRNENWHLRDKDCAELARIFDNRALHRKKDIYTKRLRAIFCGNDLRGDIEGVKRGVKRFRADGDLAYYWKRKDFAQCQSQMGESPLTDLGYLSPHYAKKALVYLVFEERVDLNLKDAQGRTIMDWSEGMMQRANKGTASYDILEAIREVIRAPRLGARKGQFSCEITGDCYCHDEHPFVHPKNVNCPPTRHMIACLGEDEYKKCVNDPRWFW